MAKDKVLARAYSGTDVGYKAEVYMWRPGRPGDDGADSIGLAPLTAREAIDMGLTLITLGLKAFR